MTPNKFTDYQQRVVDLDPSKDYGKIYHLKWGSATGKTFALVHLAHKLMGEGYEVNVVAPTPYLIDSVFFKEFHAVGGIPLHSRVSLRHIAIYPKYSPENMREISPSLYVHSPRKVLLIDEFQDGDEYVQGMYNSGAFDLVVSTGVNGVFREGYSRVDNVSSLDAPEFYEGLFDQYRELLREDFCKGSQILNIGSAEYDAE